MPPFRPYLQLPNYTLWSILLRFAFVSLIAVIVIRFVKYAGDLDGIKQIPVLMDYFIMIFAFNLLSEAQIVMDNIMEYIFPIPKKLRTRLSIQLVLSLVLIYGIYQLTVAISPDYEDVSKSVYYMTIAIGLVFVTLISSGLIMIRLTSKWVHAQKRIDVMKQEKLEMDYSALQDQLNPHFLFNNLSVLKSLIIYDKDSAVTFTENFTDVYRYVLQSKNKKLVELKEELEFIESYIGLHKERLGEGLDVNYQVDEEDKDTYIAPLALQLLVENAIKHNVASKESPLKINIKTQDNKLIIENSLQLKESSYSTRMGISNLFKRYHMLTNKEIQIESDEKEFRVKVPLL